VRVLGIETSCDETGAAIVEDGCRCVGDATLSQIRLHAEYGGVVPEIASREHILSITPAVQCALDQAGLTLDSIDAVAVTQGPGLVGSLLVGLSVAKSVAYVYDVPLIPVHHIEAHLYANYLDGSLPPVFPFLGVVASGGHTCLLACEDHHRFRVLGTTRDDAVGEAFDKVAKLLGLPYPGGVSIEQAAERGSSTAIAFPRPMLGTESLDMSFSGLKTAVLYYLRDETGPDEDIPLADVAASFQAAAIEAVVEKTRDALARTGYRTVVLAGGVAANKLLRARFRADLGIPENNVHVPPLHLCMDNGAMVASAAYFIYQAGCQGDLATNADPNLPLTAGKAGVRS